MFQLPQTQDERIRCFLTNQVCFNGESHIYRSRGRRRQGRKTWYRVHISNNDCFSVMAETDEEAIEKANKRIAKLQTSVGCGATPLGAQAQTPAASSSLARPSWRIEHRAKDMAKPSVSEEMNRSKLPSVSSRPNPRCPQCGGRLANRGLYWYCKADSEHTYARRFKHDPEGWDLTPTRYNEWPWGMGAPLDPTLWPAREV